MYRMNDNEPEVFLIHMGGPFWIKKDEGAWSIPKGEFNDDENALIAAKREFTEETSFPVEGNFISLEPLKQSGGKIIYSWMIEGDCDASAMSSNTFELEWPPRSGKFQSFPEADRAEWFSLKEAKSKIVKGQIPLLQQLESILERKS